ncbi:MAG: DUF2911 domain-containing protein [Chitinophagaceae bacterium]
MKKLILFALIIGTVHVHGQGLKTPAASTTQSVKQDFGLSTVELSYSRPNMKGRNIFGDLVPYNAVWRTGANSATTLTFVDEVTIGGTKVPAGKYGLLSIPGTAEWTFIITKQTDVTSPAAYKQDQDVVRVKAYPQTMPFSIETFMILFSDVTATSMNLMLVWDNISVSLPIKTDIESKVMAQIEEGMKSDKKPYYAAAMYYVENGKDLKKAAEWFAEACKQSPDAFWIFYQTASCYAKIGRKEEAKAAANKSIELATAAKNSDYVALNKKLLEKLN